MSLDRYRKAVSLADEIYGKLRELEDLLEAFDGRTLRRVESMRCEFPAIAAFIQAEAHDVELMAYTRIKEQTPHNAAGRKQLAYPTPSSPTT
jgi:hypothetical protein